MHYNRPKTHSGFYSVSPTCRFPTKAAALFTADGHTVSVSDDPEAATHGEGSATSLSELEGNRCSESVDVILPQRNYLIIANARAVEIQMQGLRFDLNQNQLKALRELADRMTGAKQ